MELWSQQYVTRLLRRPRIIVGEIAAIAVAGVLGAIIPQTEPGAVEAPLATAPAFMMALVKTLGLDHVFNSVWFLALILLAACSLTLALSDQWRRAWRLWRRPLAWEQMANAPFRCEIEAPLPGRLRERRERCRDSMRLGLWGSPLFHLGLLFLLGAGLLRLLFGAEAVVDLFEGETLAPSAEAYGAQWPGRLAQPFHLGKPLTLRRLQVDTYRNGDLRELAAKTDMGGEARAVAINAPLTDGANALYLTSTWGPTALIVMDMGGAPQGHALLLQHAPDGRYRGEVKLQDGTQIVAAVRRRLDPADVDVRVVRDGALLASDRLASGEALRLPGGRVLELRNIVRWARFTGRRDFATPVLYSGFALALVGACLMYGAIRVESVVRWEPTTHGVRLCVAMRPQRFAPLFASRFEQLVAESRAELEAREERAHALE